MQNHCDCIDGPCSQKGSDETQDVGLLQRAYYPHSREVAEQHVTFLIGDSQVGHVLKPFFQPRKQSRQRRLFWFGAPYFEVVVYPSVNCLPTPLVPGSIEAWPQSNSLLLIN